MPVNLVLLANPPATTLKSLIFALYWTGTYTLSGTGDPVDFTATLNPDGTKRNPSSISGAFPARVPIVWSDNSGDMAGAYIGIVKGSGLNNWNIRFYAANGTELATNGAYPAGTPATSAASSVQLTIGGLSGLF